MTDPQTDQPTERGELVVPPEAAAPKPPPRTRSSAMP